MKTNTISCSIVMLHLWSIDKIMQIILKPISLLLEYGELELSKCLEANEQIQLVDYSL